MSELACPIEECTSSLDSERALSVHLQQSHAPEVPSAYPFACPECSAPFQTNVGVEVHCREIHGIEHDAGPMPTTAADCKHCGRHMRSSHALFMHSSKVHGDRSQGARRKSPGLGKRTLEENLARAQAAREEGTTMPSGTEEFTCPHCGQTFSRPNGLTRHLRQSHGDAPNKPELDERPLRSVPAVEPAPVQPIRRSGAEIVTIEITRDHARILAALVLDHGVPLAPGAPTSIQQARDRAAALELWAALQEAAES